MYPQNPNPYGMPQVPHYPMVPQCRACGYAGPAMIVEKISTAGWVVFVVLLLCCLPLFWIGFLIKERRAQCANCGVISG
jgi:hypothetical protein